MNKTMILLAGFLLGIGLLTESGCITRNPNAGQPVINPATGQPVVDASGHTNIQPAFIPDPRIASVGSQVQGVASAIAPVNPYAALTDVGIKFGLGIIGAIAVWRAKSNGNTAATLATHLDTMAAAVVKAGPTTAQSVLNHASGSDSFAAIASAINNNTGANQSNTGA